MTERIVSIEIIGSERSPVAIIDNFSADPQALVATAVGADFQMRGEFYPGPRAPAPRSYFEEAAKVLTPIAIRVFGGTTSLQLDRALYSIATTRPDDLSLAQRIPHIDDVRKSAFAVVHYLGKAEFGGTAFYRHRSTGYETVGEARHARYLAALKADFMRLGEPPAAYIAGDTPVFERIFAASARFNRAVIYHSSLLHCAELPNDIPLPTDAAEGRLTIASFLTIK
ncbi:MAG TPA: hypothetical protein DEA50_05905 [Parvularcula sp.]|nr:hypothetical protein [Parvularcula sp.]